MRDLHVTVSPGKAYGILAGEHAAVGPLVAVKRPALVALILGTTIAISATHRVTLTLVASTSLYWSFAPLVQMLAAAIVIASSRQRRLGMARALDLFFMGHVPWSLWILAFGVRAAIGPHGTGITDYFLISALVPLVWTAIIVFAFCRTVLNSSPRGALRRTLLHQGIIWTFTIAYVVMAVQAWPRFLKALER